MNTLTNIFKNIGTRKFENIATEQGHAMEPHDKSNVKPILKKKTSFKEFDASMTIDFENPFLSVSPNLETSCGCCGCSITEIKCPSTVCESKPTVENLNYLHEVNVSIIQYYT